jgi:uncharacterized protein (UPF0332 family)
MTPFDWGDYLQLAEALNEPDKGRLQEASQRTSVSRVYFATFHWAKNYAVRSSIRNSFQDAGGEIHGKVIRFLIDHRQTRAGRLLEELRKLRNQCDYDDSVKNLDEVVNGSLRIAKEVRRLLG